MISERRPKILIVDDEPEKVGGPAAALRSKGLDVAVRSPHQLTLDDLRTADVVAVDQFLEWDNLPPHPSEVAFWPEDGLSLASVIASHLRRIDHHATIILRTGDLGQLAASLPYEVRVPIISSQYGLDWILTKGDEREAAKLHSLASATAELDGLLRNADEWNEGADWLGLEDSPWKSSALAEVQVCRPPEHSLAEYTTGSAWARWFAHRILPYPTFLISDLRAATALRLPVATFRELVTKRDNRLGQRLASFAYTGNLKELVGRRWWRAAIDDFLDELLLSASPDHEEGEALAERYGQMCGEHIRLIEAERPVVAVDADYGEVGVASVADCVRLAPDMWPIYADEPWALKEDVIQDEVLRAMVSRGDRHLT